MLEHSKLLKTLIKYLTAAVLIAVPLYPKFPLLRVPGTFVSIRLEDLLLGVCGLLVILYVLPGIKGFVKNHLHLAFIIFLFSGIVSLASAILVTKTVEPHIAILHWMRRVEYFIPFFLGFFAIKSNKENLGFYFKILLIVVVLTFIYGYGQKQFGWPIIITQNEEYSKGVALRWIPGSHINSTFAGHYDLASFLVLVLPAIISSIFILKDKWSKLILTLTGMGGIWLLVNSASRISLVSYLASALISLVLIKKYMAIPLVIVITLFMVGFNSNILSRYTRIFEITKERFINYQPAELLVNPKEIYAADEIPISRKDLTPTPVPVEIFEDRSTNIRLNVEWPRAIRAFSKNPLLGTGYSSITLATDNDYLRLLGESGLLGFFSFFLIFSQIFLALIRKFPLVRHFSGLELSFIAGVVGSFFGVFLNAVFIDVFEASKFAILFWLLMGFIVAISKNEKKLA